MGLIQNLKKRLRPLTTGELETDYLNESTSQHDLEARMREVDRGRFRKPAFRAW
jgi:Protein of unknown function (DUF3563)